jgi:hypothetical protein
MGHQHLANGIYFLGGQVNSNLRRAVVNLDPAVALDATLAI